MTMYCPTCEDWRETKAETREETYTVRGSEIRVPVAAHVCVVCGEAIGSDDEDQAVLDAVHAAYRREEDLLTPERIKAIRQRYRLSQRSFANLLGMGEATINRYENGALQDPAHDTAIRACEKPEVLREQLERRGHLLTEWQRNRALKALAGQVEQDKILLGLLDDDEWLCVPRGASEETGFRQYDGKRLAAAVAWFCTRLGQVWKVAINKLLFYSDFLNFKTATVSLTGSPYRRVQFGPVPADYGAILDWMDRKGMLVCEEVPFANGNTGYSYSPGPNANAIAIDFTAHEQKVLEHVASTLGHMSAVDLKNKSHEEPAWKDTEDRKIISYQKAHDLSLSLAS